ncbi:hypothetical protein TUZN_1718 [Thermoproteus uzoniensis 768-20]|uniref:Uncharacterized protein n=1 Tax=Thermoproteus uzoniensis (strain 768-20) TaxID=999630 RepID=F2L361_THEU7|nr:hypothetical protein TUZN_1718 [Thermoproteus uzoniensis 768-20]
MDKCVAEAAGGRLAVKTPLGTFDVEPTPSDLLSLAEKLAAVCGEDQRRLYDKLRDAALRRGRPAPQNGRRA